MSKTTPFILAACLLLRMESPVRAVVGQPVMDPGGQVIGTISDIKTPPLRTSDTFLVPIELHNSFDIPNWAGFRVKFHILDGTEISITPLSILHGIGSMGSTVDEPLVPPDFPQSTPSVETVPFFRTETDPSAPFTGRLFAASEWRFLVDFVLHAKNTDIGENSDIDMTVMAWNLRHLGPGQGSTFVGNSALVWATPNFQPTPEQPVMLNPPPLGDHNNGAWVHYPFEWHVPQLTPGQTGFWGSQIIATLAGTATIGLEHVPEPLSGGLLALAGALMMGWGWQLRRRRLALL